MALTRISEFLGDGPAPVHRVAELWFEDAEALERAKESPELEAAADDVVEVEALRRHPAQPGRRLGRRRARPLHASLIPRG